jgi:hypothetical protein
MKKYLMNLKSKILERYDSHAIKDDWQQLDRTLITTIAEELERALEALEWIASQETSFPGAEKMLAREAIASIDKLMGEM